jgi:hypothetical protein
MTIWRFEVQVAGIAAAANGLGMSQIGRISY